MLLSLDIIISFLLLGCVVGFMAGLLGIGGGGIMVPILSTIFLAHDVPIEQVIHLALGTSMASIIITSAASMRAHHQHQAVLWPVVQKIAPGVILGTFIATYFVTFMRAEYLAIFFSLFMAYVAIQMLINFQARAERELPGRLALFLAGKGIGAVSAVVAIGGGTLTVPYLVWNNINLKQAIGTSAAIGFPIAIAGTFGYLWHGWQASSDIQYLFGYVYLPAVLLISVVSYFTAPLGARLAHRLPVPALKKVFAVFLVYLSLKMLTSII